MKELKLSKSKPVRMNPSVNPALYDMEREFNYYIQNVQPLVFEYSLQSPNGIHGIETHTASVVFRGIDIALSLRQDPRPVIMACACHDMGRTSDIADNDHAFMSAKLTLKLLKRFPEFYNDTEMRHNILSAVLNHTTGTVSSDYISACTWDADRIRMSWEAGFDAKFFNTARGKFIASSYFRNYLDFQKRCLAGYAWSKKY